ncbi:MAG: hypothetical protein H6867_06200 [Rhodospirillales bacterium]|nr:hypothetical protein [Rhodospirillales bacterium]
MKKNLLCGAMALVLVLAYGPVAGAQDDEEPMVHIITDVDGKTTVEVPEEQKPDTAQQDFAAGLATASRQGDMVQFWELVHPDALECMSDDFKTATEIMNFAGMTKAPIPEQYTVSVDTVPEDDIKEFFVMMFGMDVSIPVMPTHSLSIYYDADRGVCPSVHTTQMRYIAEKDGRWYEAMPCPGSMPMEVSALKARIEESEKKAAEQFASLTDAQRSDLRKLYVDDGNKIAAMKKASEDLGIEMGEARTMLEHFCRDDD